MLSNSSAPAERARRDPERGNVIMSMLVILILGALTASAVALSQSTLRTTERAQDQDLAIGGIDLAIAEATTRIELGETVEFSGKGSVGETTYRYTATPGKGTAEWIVYGEGIAGDVRSAAEVTVTGTFTGANPYAFVVNTKMDLAKDSVSISEPIAVNGSIAVSGTTGNLRFHLFNPLGRCSGCTNTETFPTAWPTPTPATPATSRACPFATLTESNGRQSTVYGLLGTLDGQNGVPYRCTFNSGNSVFGHMPIIIYETITIKNPPLIVHVDDRVTLWFLRANVNPTGRASDFRVQAVGGPTTANGYQYGQFWDDGTKLTGVVYAPQRQLQANSVNIRGAFTVGALSSSSSASVIVQAESSVVDSSRDWAISNWHRVEVRP